MDERYLLARARYIENNPVRANLTAKFGPGNPGENQRRVIINTLSSEFYLIHYKERSIKDLTPSYS